MRSLDGLKGLSHALLTLSMNRVKPGADSSWARIQPLCLDAYPIAHSLSIVTIQTEVNKARSRVQFPGGRLTFQVFNPAIMIVSIQIANSDACCVLL